MTDNLEVERAPADARIAEVRQRIAACTRLQAESERREDVYMASYFEQLVERYCAELDFLETAGEEYERDRL